jgi:hypothetical protein
MKVYRGPASKPFSDDMHEHVSTVGARELYDGVAQRATIKFNISKDARDRQAVCHLLFEDDDFVPMIDALLIRIKLQQEAISKMRTVLKSKTSDEDKLFELDTLLRSAR